MLVSLSERPRRDRNIERRTPNTEHRISNPALCIRRWAFDVRRWAFASFVRIRLILDNDEDQQPRLGMPPQAPALQPLEVLLLFAPSRCDVRDSFWDCVAEVSRKGANALRFFASSAST